MNRVQELWEKGWDHIAATAAAQKIWAYYEAAAPREQLALKILGVFLSILVAALLIVAPLHQFNKNATADYREQQETLAWMESNRHLVNAAAPSARQPGTSLLTVANQSARNFGLGFKRYEPRGDNGLNLWLEKVPFNQVVKWLGALERDFGVVAADFSVSRRDEAGLVDVRLILEG